MALRLIAHVLLFVIAVMAAFFGLGIGLAFHPTAGTVLLGIAVAIIVINVYWIMQRDKAPTG